MNYSLNVKSSSIVHTLLSNCAKLLGKVQKLLIKCISYSVISKRIRVVSPKFYTARKNFTGPPVPTVPTNFKSEWAFITPRPQKRKLDCFFVIMMMMMAAEIKFVATVTTGSCVYFCRLFKFSTKAMHSQSFILYVCTHTLCEFSSRLLNISTHI